MDITLYDPSFLVKVQKNTTYICFSIVGKPFTIRFFFMMEYNLSNKLQSGVVVFFWGESYVS